MQVSNDILQKFAKIVEPNDNKKEPLLEFYGKVIEQIDETYWKVRPSVGDESTKEIELPDSGNMLICSSQVDVKPEDEVRYKVEGNNAVIIENKTNPIGNEVVVKHIEDTAVWQRLSNDPDAQGYRFGKIIYEIPRQYLAELLETYSILGVGSVYLKVKPKDSDTYSILWDNNDDMVALSSTTSFLGYNLLYTGQNKPYSIKFAWYSNPQANNYDFLICVDLLLINSNKSKNV